jgi:prephenate dehydrogenase
VLTPASETARDAIEAVRRLVLDCGAQPVEADAQLHDDALAVTSHVPQIVASLTAARLVDAEPGTLSLAGQGLRDMTRIADSDPDLWSQIVAANAGPVLSVLDAFAADLDRVRAELRSLRSGTAPRPEGGNKPNSQPPDKETDRLVDIARAPDTSELIRRGNEGRGRLPGKHGAARVEFATVPVVVSDRPGELARLLVASGAAGVNVEDVAIEHSPGQPVGLVELAVRPEVAEQLAAALRAGGWSVHA